MPDIHKYINYCIFFTILAAVCFPSLQENLPFASEASTLSPVVKDGLEQGQFVLLLTRHAEMLATQGELSPNVAVAFFCTKVSRASAGRLT